MTPKLAMTMTLPAPPTVPADTSMMDGLTMMVIALHPIAGIVAFACAVGNMLRYGIAAIGILALSQWVSNFPSTIRDGFTLNGDAFANGYMIVATFGLPLIGASALAAALSNRHLTAATIAIMLPTIVTAAGIAAFAISVFLYGF